MAYPGQNVTATTPWYVGDTGAHWMSPQQYTGLATSTGRGGADIEQLYRSQQVGRGAPGSAAEMTAALGMGFSNWQQQQQGGGGGAPQGPYGGGGGFNPGGVPQGPLGSATGTPQSVEQARQMAFQGTLDPWIGQFDNDPKFQELFGRTQDIAMGRNQLNYDPLRAEASDQAAGAAGASQRDLRAGMANRGLRVSPGAMYATQAPIRRDLGTAHRRIGFQESQAQMAREDSARSAASGMYSMAGQNRANAWNARLGQLGQMQEVTGGGGSFRAGSRQPTVPNMYDQYFASMAKHGMGPGGGAGGGAGGTGGSGGVGGPGGGDVNQYGMTKNQYLSYLKKGGYSSPGPTDKGSLYKPRGEWG